LYVARYLDAFGSSFPINQLVDPFVVVIILFWSKVKAQQPQLN